ncbi:MAG: hypothetical protein ACRDHC_03585, partial [Actinomycetota bacterium]
ARRCGASGSERLATLLATQSRLLAGAGTTTASHQGRGEPHADPETDAVTEENHALRALREGDPVRAHAHLQAAATSWDSLGATVWSARALRMSAETAHRAGRGRVRAGLVKRSESLLDVLGTPAPARLAIRRMSEDLLRLA